MKAGWEALAIADFAKTAAGGTPLKGKPEFYEGGQVPWLLSGEVCQRNISETKNFITDEGLKGSSAKVFPVGAVLVAMYGATAGQVGILRCEAATNQAVCAVLPNSRYVPEYLYYFLLLEKENLVAQSVGNAQPNISQAKIKETLVPLPPLDEQKRIVAVLDAAFEGLTRASAHTETNLQNARELLGTTVDALLFDPGRLWKEKRLGSIVHRLTNGFVGPTRDIYQEVGVPYLLARHVKSNELKFDDRTHVSDSFNEKNKKSKLKAGDVLLVQSGHIGHSAVVPPEHEGHNCHAMIVISPFEDVLTGDYLSIFFSSASMQRGFEAIRSGSTVPHLTCKEVREIAIPIPSLSEQLEIVREVKDMKGSTKLLQSHYRAKLADLDDLRQSLLQRAFAGELT